MLILSRKKGESILIGDNVELKILEICKEHIRIGITAPRECKVVRKELFLIRQANRDAAQRRRRQNLSQFLENFRKKEEQ